jgi:hypothetical protein
MKIYKLVLLLFFAISLIAGEFPADPSKITLSFKQHTVGRNKVVSNLGDFNIPSQFQLDGGARHIPANDKPPEVMIKYFPVGVYGLSIAIIGLLNFFPVASHGIQSGLFVKTRL